MKVLMISTDRKIFEADAEVRKRMAYYGSLVSELHIIVFGSKHIPRKVEISSTVWAYGTHSKTKVMRLVDAYRIGKKILTADNDWIITTQDPFETGMVGYRLSKRYHIPLQLQIHTDFLNPFFIQESFVNRIRVYVARFLLLKATRIRVVSDRIKESIIANYKLPITRIVVMPVFVDVEKIRRTSLTTDLHKKYPTYTHIVLMASRLTREKNIPMALEAIRGLTQTKTPINADKILLLIVGEGPERARIQLLITNYKLQKNVILEPWTDNLISYYKTADLFLLTSHYEGFGRTIVEALAVSCPVVALDVGIAREAGAIIISPPYIGETINKILQSKKRGVLKFSIPPQSEVVKDWARLL